MQCPVSWRANLILFHHQSAGTYNGRRGGKLLDHCCTTAGWFWSAELPVAPDADRPPDQLPTVPRTMTLESRH